MINLILLIYLSGALISCGITYTVYSIDNHVFDDMYKSVWTAMIPAMLFSWLTIILFIIGLIKSIFQGDDDVY